MVPRVSGTKTATSASTILRGGHQTDQVDAVSSSPYLCLEAARCVAGVAYREAIVAGWPISDARDLADNVFAACKDVGPGRMDEPLARARALLATTSDSYATQPKTDMQRLEDDMAALALDTSAQLQAGALLPTL